VAMSLWGESEAEVSIIEEETGERDGPAEKLDRYKHFPCLIFFLFIFYHQPTYRIQSLFSSLLSSLGLMLLLIPTLPPPIHPSLLRPLQIPDSLPPFCLSRS
jgi:hypothetical protein